MIQFFPHSQHPQPLKELPFFKNPCKVISINYPHNMITKIRPHISKAVNAQKIDLSHNKIISIDPIFDLLHLKTVILSYNMISSVGINATKLVWLQSIDLSYNLISKVDSIKGLTELWKVKKGNIAIMLEGNEIMRKDADKFEAAFRRIDSEEEKQNSKALDFSMILPVTSGELTDVQKNNTKKFERADHSKLLLDISASLNEKEETEKKSYISAKIKNPDKSYLSILNDICLNRDKPSLSFSSEEINLKQENKKLADITQKFQILLKSCKWPQILSDPLRSQAELIVEYGNIVSGLVTTAEEGLERKVLSESVEKAASLRARIKELHERIIVNLNLVVEAPLKTYKIWVNLFRDMQVVGQKIIKKGWDCIVLEERRKQLLELEKLSPDKKLGPNMEKSPPKQKTQELENLLFSNNKNKSHEEQQGENSKKSKDEQCDECFLKKEYINQMKEQLTEVKSMNLSLKTENNALSKKIERLILRNKCLEENTSTNQNIIIEQLSTEIDSNVYQAILLEQARGIEDLLRFNSQFSQNQVISNGKNQRRQKYPSNDRTDLEGSQNYVGSNQITSRRKYNEEDPNMTMNTKISYFAHQNSSSSEKNRNLSNGKRIKTHLSNSDTVGGKESNASKEEKAGKNGHSTSTNYRRSISTADKKPSITSKSKDKTGVSGKFGIAPPITEEEYESTKQAVFVSDFVITENGSHQISQDKSKLASKCESKEFPVQQRQNQSLLLNDNESFNNHSEQPKNRLGVETKNKIAMRKGERRESKGSERKETSRKKEGISNVQEKESRNESEIKVYRHYEYHPIELKMNENYQNYMLNHLRNSIVETLAKKSEKRQYRSFKQLSKVIRDPSLSVGKITNTERGRSKQSTRKSAPKFIKL